MFATDEIGQSSAQFDNICDNIIRLLCGVNIYKGNKLEVSTYDPTQLQPIRGHPFLVSPNVIPCYKIVQIKHSVRAQNPDFFRIQQIARKITKSYWKTLSLLLSLNSYVMALLLYFLGIHH